MTKPPQKLSTKTNPSNTLSSTPSSGAFDRIGSSCSARARGDADERSDYDIAIDCEALTPRLLAEIRADMETIPTLREIEIVWLNRAAEGFRRRIEDEGRVLYEEKT